MIYVRMFDNLQLHLSEGKNCKMVSFPTKAGCFLAYLLLNRKRYVSKEELFDTFWNNPSRTNPNSALKTLVHRIREILNQELGENDYILEENGNYCWNMNLDVEIDAELFEQNFAKLDSTSMEDTDAITLYEETLQLYKDDFLRNVRDYYWTDLNACYYRSMMIRGIVKLALLYKKTKDYESLEYICESCVRRNIVDEDLHYYLIVSKIFLNKRDEARLAYKRAKRLLKKELGVDHPEKIESLKERVFHQENLERKALESVCNEIEEEALNGALVCHYLIFKEICRLEYRRMQREQIDDSQKGEYRHLLLITVYDRTMEIEKDGDSIREESMAQIIELVKKSLRAGDVMAKCSSNQCVLLLHACSDKSWVEVSRRLVSEVKKNYQDIYCEIQYKSLSSEGNI